MRFGFKKKISYSKKLSGAPDYLIAKRSPLGNTVLDTPLIIIVEAKKNDFEQRWDNALRNWPPRKN